MLNLRARRILAVDPSHVHVGTSVFHVLYVTLRLENSNNCQDGVVRQGWLVRQRLQHLMHRSGAFLPKHIHYSQLCFRQSRGLGARQSLLPPR